MISPEKFGEQEAIRKILHQQFTEGKINKNIEHNRVKKALNNLQQAVEESGPLSSLKKDILFSQQESENRVQAPETEKALEYLHKIGQFEQLETLIPKKLKITKQEYLLALQDTHKKELVLKKIDNSLDIMYRSSRGFPLFKSSPLTRNSMLANHSLADLQGIFIDLKRTLVS